MATHSSTLAWQIPWMEGPGRLQSMGSKNNFDMSVFDGILLKPVTKDSLAIAFQDMLDSGRLEQKS